MFSCALFQSATILLVAATVRGWNAYVEKVRLTGAVLVVDVELDVLEPQAATTSDRATAPAQTGLTEILISSSRVFSSCWQLGGQAPAVGLPLPTPRQQARGKTSLQNGEEDEARQSRQQGGGRQWPETDVALGADEPGQRQGQRRQLRSLQDDQSEEELIPGRDERKQTGHHETRNQQRHDDVQEDSQPSGPI